MRGFHLVVAASSMSLVACSPSGGTDPPADAHADTDAFVPVDTAPSPDAGDAGDVLEADVVDADAGPTGDGLFGGFIASLVVDRHAKGTVYAAPKAEGGLAVLKSTDFGAHWSRLEGSATHGGYARLLVDPTVAGHVLALGAEGNLLRTDDGGATWKALRTDTLIDVAMAPSRPQRLYALGDDACGDGKLTSSDDGGVTWSCLLTAPAIGHSGIQVSSRDPDVVVLSGGVDFAVDTPARRSTDGGKTWVDVPGPIDVTFGPDVASPAFGASKVSLFRSDDDAATFRSLATAFAGHVTFDPADAKLLFVAAADRLLRSSDAGATFVDVPGSPPDVHELAFDPNDAAKGWAASGFVGVLATTDGGAHWADVAATIRALPLRSLRGSPANTSRLYVYTDRGLFSSGDRGHRWTLASGVADEWAVAASDAAVVYRRDAGGDLLRTADAGVTWKVIHHEPTTGRRHGLAVSLADAAHVTFVGEAKLHASTDGGATWSDLPLPTGVDPATVSGLFPLGSGGLLLTGPYDGFFTSPDGVTWTKVFAGVLDYGAAVATSGAVSYACTLAGLAKSIDDGAHWSIVHDADTGCLDVSVAPADPSAVFLVTTGGLLASKDGGATWTTTAALVPGCVWASSKDALVACSELDVTRSDDGGATWK